MSEIIDERQFDESMVEKGKKMFVDCLNEMKELEHPIKLITFQECFYTNYGVHLGKEELKKYFNASTLIKVFATHFAGFAELKRYGNDSWIHLKQEQIPQNHGSGSSSMSVRSLFANADEANREWDDGENGGWTSRSLQSVNSPRILPFEDYRMKSRKKIRFGSREEAQAYMNEQASKPQSEEAAKWEELAKSRNTWDDSSSGVTVEPNENKTTTDVSSSQLPWHKPHVPPTDDGAVKGGFRNSKRARELNNPNVDGHTSAHVDIKKDGAEKGRQHSPIDPQKVKTTRNDAVAHISIIPKNAESTPKNGGINNNILAPIPEKDDVECKNGKKVPERPDELKTFLTGHIIKLFDDGIRLVNEKSKNTTDLEAENKRLRDANLQLQDKLGKYEVENGRLRMENQNLQKKLNNLKELANAVNAE